MDLGHGVAVEASEGEEEVRQIKIISEITFVDACLK